MLGEDNQLLPRGRPGLGDFARAIRNCLLCDPAAEPARGENLAQQAGELSPLRIRAAATHAQGEGFQPGERFDFGLQLGDRAGGRGLVKNLFFGGGDLFLGRVFQVLDVFRGEFQTDRRDQATGLAATLKHLEFTQTALQTLASPAQRAVDRLG